MDRKHFLRLMGMLPLTGAAMQLQDLRRFSDTLAETDAMPVLFVGHGSPMNAIEDNVFSREMKAMGQKVPKPKAILMVSAHWETRGTFVTAQEKPPTIHDFGGFPQALFDVQYPAPGSKWLAGETKSAVKKTTVADSNDWGFDHGCWSVTRNMFPGADIPIIQISLDYTQPPQYHYDLANELSALRRKGVLIIGSGNMVHNLGRIVVPANGDLNSPYGLDWALEARSIFNKYLQSGNHQPLINYKELGKSVQLSVPTPEHYLPLLYVLAQQEKTDQLSLFNDVAVAGSLTMTSVLIGKV